MHLIGQRKGISFTVSGIKCISSGKEKTFHLHVGIKFTSSGNEKLFIFLWPFLPEQIVRNPGQPRSEIVFLA
jgi:hypothetical protein